MPDAFSLFFARNRLVSSRGALMFCSCVSTVKSTWLGSSTTSRRTSAAGKGWTCPAGRGSTTATCHASATGLTAVSQPSCSPTILPNTGTPTCRASPSNFPGSFFVLLFFPCDGFAARAGFRFASAFSPGLLSARIGFDLFLFFFSRCGFSARVGALCVLLRFVCTCRDNAVTRWESSLFGRWTCVIRGVASSLTATAAAGTAFSSPLSCRLLRLGHAVINPGYDTRFIFVPYKIKPHVLRNLYKFFSFVCLYCP